MAGKGKEMLQMKKQIHVNFFSINFKFNLFNLQTCFLQVAALIEKLTLNFQYACIRHVCANTNLVSIHEIYADLYNIFKVV